MSKRDRSGNRHAKHTHIKLKEPFSVINLAHVGEPFLAPSGATCPNGSPGWASIAPGGEIMAP